MTHNSFSCIFISILYMFQAVMCPSSGQSIVSMWYLVYVTLCRWLSDVQVNLHTRWSSTQSDIYQISHWFSWWWEHDCLKHVENRNKYTWKTTVRQVGYLQRLYRDAQSMKHKIPMTLCNDFFLILCIKLNYIFTDKGYATLYSIPLLNTAD